MSGAGLTQSQRQRIDRAFDEVPFVKFLGIELVEVEQGRAVMRVFVRQELRRNGGVVHGGVTASLIDTAAAFAIMTTLAPDQASSTVDLTVHYLRPIVSGNVTAHARVVRNGRRVVIASVDVVDEAEILLATALTTYIRSN